MGQDIIKAGIRQKENKHKCVKIAAVVVTSNRKKLLLECLKALKNQTYPLDAIFIIDNSSTDGTPGALLEYGYIQKLPPKTANWSWETESVIQSSVNNKLIKVQYVRLYKNTGCSGGFYEGVKRAYEKGYDWIFLMDDDAELIKDSLEILVRYLNLPDAVALTCLKVDEKGNVLYYHKGYFYFEGIFKHIVRPINDSDYKNKDFVEIDFASFVGILVNSHAIKTIGFPDKRFFIYHDDVEYCIRLRSVGKIYLIPNSIIIHKENLKKKGLIEKSFLGRKIYRLPYNESWRTYYVERNLTYLRKMYSKSRIKFIGWLLTQYLRLFVVIILFDDHKLRRIWLITSAYIDGLKGMFDNEKPKKILYRGTKSKCHKE